eukprot:scaffold1514_cov28-Tisochrysis_lutea.AAC.2
MVTHALRQLATKQSLRMHSCSPHCVDNPSADPPLYPDGKLAVGHAVGTGANTVGQAHTSCPSVETLQAMPSDRNAVGHARD